LSNSPKIYSIFYAIVLLAIFYASSVAHGGSVHPHHVVSPFDKAQNIKPLHCSLKMHQHLLNSPCPHKGQVGEDSGEMIRSECGSSTGTSNSSRPYLSKELLRDTNYEIFLLFSYSRIKPSLDILPQLYPQSIDKPPQLT
jgi:hypothetical protein